MNFIEIVRRVKLESGRLTAGPASVSSASGRDLMIVNWVRDAWRQLQEMPRSWAWKRKTASDLPILQGFYSYGPAALGIDDHGDWAPEDDSYRPRVYEAATPSSYTLLRWVSYSTFQAAFLRPGTAPGMPQYWSESPAGDFLLGPVPDRNLMLSVDYYDAPQDLSIDTDIPALPERHHTVIVWRALEEVAKFDAAPELAQRAKDNYAREFDSLVERQGQTMTVMGR